MKKALFIRIFAVITLAVILCCTVATITIANNEIENKKSEMLMILKFMSVTYNSTDKHDYSLAHIFSENADNARVVFIDNNGVVFVDTGISGEPDENHNDRKEVILANQTGYGVDIRKSKTIGKYQLYASYKADNGDIIRISYNINGFIYFIPQILPAMLLAIIISLLFCAFITKGIIKRIMNPINEVSNSLTLMKDGDYSMEIPPHKYDELNGFIYIFNSLKKNIRDNINKLKREKKLEHFIFENMIEGIVLFNENFSIISANSSAKRLLNCKNDVNGKSIHYLIHNNSVLSAVENVVYQQKSAMLDVNIKDQIIAIHIAPVSGQLLNDKHNITTDNNQVVLHGGLMVLTDVTQQRSVEIMRQEFFANAGHELKTPLTTIIGFAELMENRLVPDDKKEYCVSKILSESKRMANLINDILQISHLESSKKHEERTNCDMLKIASEIKNNFTLQASEKNITITINGNGFTFNASLKHMHELIENLVSNAVKYNKPNGNVNITIEQKYNYGVITVSDTGIGIPVSSQNRVFERFYRVDKGRSTNSGSTGLGLSIVKHIVNAYKGSISLKSDLNIGTTIAITFNI